jgi:hypothetical protein
MRHTPPQPDTKDGELEQILVAFAERYDMPYKFMHNNEKTPMEQMPLARQQLINEAVAALKARDARREAEAKSLAQQQGFLAGFRRGFNSVDEDVATEECRKWQATLKEKTKDE